jgi:iron complex outermembrane receptor protein
MKFAGCGRIAALLAASALAGAAHAQEVDYGGLEQIFGAPVTTSATGSPQLASQAPADMQIISADDIRRSGATDIPGVLQFVAGIDVRKYGALDNEVAIRGFSQSFNPRLLVLINGRQVYIDDYGYTAWQALPVQLSEIRQIEIVRGPASALFGFNAASGVINILTYDPLHDKIDALNVGIGSSGTLEGSLVGTVQEPGKFGARISLGGLKTNEFSETSVPAIYQVPRPDMGSFSISAADKPVSNVDVTAEITGSSSRDFDNSDFIPGAIAYRFQSYKFGVAADTPLGIASVQAYLNQDRTFINDAYTDHLDIDNQIFSLQASDLIKFADVHAVRVGLEFRDNRAWGLLYDGAIGYLDYAADAMWNWQATPQLSFTAAGRVDHLVLNRKDPLSPVNPISLSAYDASLTAPSFNLGLVYQPTGDDTLRLLAGRGVQAPSLLDFSAQYVIPVGPFYAGFLGQPDIKPSTVTNYEVDYDRNLAALNSTASAALYYQVDQGFLLSGISTGFSYIHPPVLLAVSENVGSATSVGGEFSFHGSTDNWRWNAAYSLFTVHQALSHMAPVNPLDFSTATPTSEITFGLGYTWQKFEADMQGKWESRYTDYVSENLVFVPRQINDYVMLNGRLGYAATPQLTVAVDGQQLGSARLTDSAGLPADRRVLFTATYGF